MTAVYKYGVHTIERNTVTTEEYDTNANKFVRVSQVTRDPRMTYCDSAEEAFEFMREIKLRQHPNIINYDYRGLMTYHP